MTLNFGRFKGRKLEDLPLIYVLFLYLNSNRIPEDIRKIINNPCRIAHYRRSIKLFNKKIFTEKMKEFSCDLLAPVSTQGDQDQT